MHPTSLKYSANKIRDTCDESHDPGWSLDKNHPVQIRGVIYNSWRDSVPDSDFRHFLEFQTCPFKSNSFFEMIQFKFEPNPMVELISLVIKFCVRLTLLVDPIPH